MSTKRRGLEICDLRMLRQLGEASRGQWLYREGECDRAWGARTPKGASWHRQQVTCHTAEIGGYIIKGHFPATDIKRLVAERPEAIGLAVPGIPVGSPGMERGSESEPYDVLLLNKDGTTEVFARR